MQDELPNIGVKVGIGLGGSLFANMAPHEVVSFIAGTLTAIYIIDQIIVISPKVPGAIRYWYAKWKNRGGK